LGVQPVFCLWKQQRLAAVGNFVGNFLATVGGAGSAKLRFPAWLEPANGY